MQMWAAIMEQFGRLREQEGGLNLPPEALTQVQPSPPVKSGSAVLAIIRISFAMALHNAASTGAPLERGQRSLDTLHGVA